MLVNADGSSESLSNFEYYELFNSHQDNEYMNNPGAQKKITLLASTRDKRNLVSSIIATDSLRFETMFNNRINGGGLYEFAKSLLVDTIAFSKMVIKDAIG